MDRNFLWNFKLVCDLSYGLVMLIGFSFISVQADDSNSLMPAPNAEVLAEISEVVQEQKNTKIEKKDPEPINKSPIPEVLVFIDVSGSMKLNDPSNIRAPALRMLAGMAPASARVGIYTFGTSVSELVSPAMVDDTWRRQVKATSKSIRSRDMYTNIEAVLETANRYWFEQDYEKKHDNKGMRNIILLTDGIVDIDKDSVVSNESRERILLKSLPDLIKHQVGINTITLSTNADHDLLAQLSIHTEANNEVVEDAESLQRIFLKLFEQSAPQDTLPLNDNRFNVDASISEVTLLLFSQKDKATILYAPDETQYTKQNHPDYISWNKDIGYELITIRTPQSGEWLLDAALDPDNRAMIVTDLKLRTDELPANVLNGESLDWLIWLEEEGELISRPDFLSLLKANVSLELSNGEQRQWKLSSADQYGLFSHKFNPEWPAGKFDVLLTVDGKTFQRQRRMTMTAHKEPIRLEIMPLYKSKETEKLILEQEDASQQTSAWQFQFHTYADLIKVNASSLNIIATSQTGNQTEVDYELMLDKEGMPVGWQSIMLAEELGQYLVEIEIRAQSHSGREISIQLPEKMLGEKVEISKPKPTSIVPSLMEVLIPVGIGNVLILLVLMMFFIFRRMQAEQTIYPEDAL